MRFDARVDIGEGADRARNGAGRDFFARGLQTQFAARKFGIGLGELEPEGHGFGVDAMAAADRRGQLVLMRSEEHTSELQSLMRISYAVFCLKKKKKIN